MPVTGETEGKNSKVLIVEDSHTQALRLQSLLEENGFEVSVAHDGAEGLRVLREEKFDLVVSDIVMPEMDGYEMCRRIKEDDDLGDIPVILLTQLSEPEDIVRGLGSGADKFIIKPYQENLLISQIQNTLVNREMRKDLQTDLGIEIFFAGKRHFINCDRMQMLNLLFSTYENSLEQKRELEKTNRDLKEALDTIKILHGILPICSNCKKIRDDKGGWHQIEEYISERSDAQFSHGICPDCMEKLYPEFSED
ncbi:MAG: response regulator [Deltaproteobacteria bacterium]|nr:response regulator [Deltaproteobacteria bacterium]MBW2050446.1 response regulator [Deltaproteobacteria bacterium]HDZ91051.1 response regulator [Deltaproteobacteria bacterium]